MYKFFLPKQLFSSSSVFKVGVIGSGQMGTGIGIVANMVAKSNVIMIDNKNSIKNSEIFVNKWLNKELDKGKLQQTDLDGFKNRLRYSEKIEEVAECDFVIEVREGNNVGDYRE
jgi:3-hydroxybutyryl-CoA dehydrogenase